VRDAACFFVVSVGRLSRGKKSGNSTTRLSLAPHDSLASLDWGGADLDSAVGEGSGGGGNGTAAVAEHDGGADSARRRWRCRHRVGWYISVRGDSGAPQSKLGFRGLAVGRRRGCGGGAVGPVVRGGAAGRRDGERRCGSEGAGGVGGMRCGRMTQMKEPQDDRGRQSQR
jgi:hypothetical protein